MVDPASLAAAKATLAVINGDYFDTMTQGDAIPRGPIVRSGVVDFAPRGWAKVLAFDANGAPRSTAARAWAQVTTSGARVRTAGINNPYVGTKGLGIFTSAWGRSYPGVSAWAVAIKESKVARVFRPGELARIPRSGYLLTLPSSSSPATWQIGQTVQVQIHVESKDGETLWNASGHGGAVLHDGKVERLCSDYEDVLRPRSMIAWAPDGRMWLLTASTGQPDPPDGVRMGGATKTQLALFAQSLGATTGVVMDGGGSTALFIHPPGKNVHRLDLGAKAWVRPIPVAWTLTMSAGAR